jgi:hypothetical protein
MKTKKRSKTQYEVEVTYKGYDRDYDCKIRRVVGRDNRGTGCGFGDRDIQFYFIQEKAAKAAIARIRKQCRQMNTRASLSSQCIECYEEPTQCTCDK